METGTGRRAAGALAAVLLVASGFLVATSPPAAGGEPHPLLKPAWQLSSVGYQGLVYDAEGRVGYGYQPGGTWPTSVEEIDPLGLVHARQLPEHTDPPVDLALSDDDSTLLIAHGSEHSVDEANTASVEVDRTVALSVGGQPAAPVRLAPAPGDADRYVVLVDGGEALVLVDGGAVVDEMVFDAPVEQISFTGDASVLYAQEAAPSGTFLTIGIAGDSFAAPDEDAGIGASGPLPWTEAEGILYTADGRAIDPVAATQDVMATVGAPTAPAAIDVVQRRAFFIQGNDVSEHDLDTGLLAGTHLNLSDGISSAAVYTESAVVRNALVLGHATRYTVRLIGDGPLPPGAPNHVGGQARSDSVRLQWRGVFGGQAPDVYEVRRDGAVVHTYHPPFGPAETHVFRDTDVVEGEQYRYELSASNEAGESFPHVFELTAERVQIFDDVPVEHAFNEEISWGSDEGIINGYDDRRFRPGNPVTRQAMAAFVYRFAGSPPPPIPVSQLPVIFRDVPRSNPFFLEITFLWSSELSDGFPDGTYRPLGVISRQAMAAFLYRMVGSPPPPVPVGQLPVVFSDVQRNHPFFVEISFAEGVGIVAGYPDGTFRGSNQVTRQAAAAFLYRLDGVFSDAGATAEGGVTAATADAEVAGWAVWPQTTTPWSRLEEAPVEP